MGTMRTALYEILQEIEHIQEREKKVNGDHMSIANLILQDIIMIVAKTTNWMTISGHTINKNLQW